MGEVEEAVVREAVGSVWTAAESETAEKFLVKQNLVESDCLTTVCEGKRVVYIRILMRPFITAHQTPPETELQI